MQDYRGKGRANVRKKQEEGWGVKSPYKRCKIVFE